MDDSASCILLFLVLGALAFVGGAIYRRHRLGLRAKDAILMDGAVFRAVGDGGYVIERTRGYNFFVGGCLLPGVVLLIGIPVLFIFRESPLGIALTVLPVLAVCYLGVRWVIKMNARPSFHFDGDAQEVKIGGREERAVPFAGIEALEALKRPARRGFRRVYFEMRLGDGERLDLGSLSGDAGRVPQQAAHIAERLAGLTGVRFTMSEIDDANRPTDRPTDQTCSGNERKTEKTR